MITVTYTQVQKLVKKIPAQKLAIAYRFLTDLTEDKTESLSPQIKFMQPPLSERRRILAEQAQQMARIANKSRIVMNSKGGIYRNLESKFALRLR